MVWITHGNIIYMLLISPSYGKVEGEELQLLICRFRIPFYPLDEAKFIFPFEEDCNEDM